MNLDSLPSIEDAQAIIDSIQVYANEKHVSLNWYFSSGKGCIWLPLNKDWGLKIFYREDWGSGSEGTIRNATDAYEAGIGPYVHGIKHLVNFDGKMCPCFFMQRVPVVLNSDEYQCYRDNEEDEYFDNEEIDNFVKHCRQFGFYDLIPENLGILDGKLVMIDSSHRKFDF